MWSWKQTNVQFSQSSRTGTEYGHWLNSRKVKKYSKLGMKFKKKIKIPVGKSYTPRILQPRPAYFPEIILPLYFLSITYPSIRKEYFNLEHLLTDGRMVENLTPTYGFWCVLGYRKKQKCFWLALWESGKPNWSLKMQRTRFQPIKISCSNLFNLKPHGGTKDL